MVVPSAARMEQALEPLIGLPLRSMGRVLDLEWFGFGRSREVTARSGRTKIVEDWALHVQCAWRLSAPHCVITGRHDLYYPAGDPEARSEGWSPFEEGARSRLDERTEQLLAAWEASPPVVNGVSADALGGIRLSLTNGHVLEVWPDDSVPRECWRLFEPYRDKPHFVVGGEHFEKLNR